VSLSHYQGKVIVLDFWASWCAPCVAELPVFQDLHERYNGKGFEVVGVNLSDQNPDIGGFLKEKNIHYTNLVGNDSIEKLYGPITGYPTTFIIDRGGTSGNTSSAASPERDRERGQKGPLGRRAFARRRDSSRRRRRPGPRRPIFPPMSRKRPTMVAVVLLLRWPG
jgi:peroxiredoxin